ncbi:hypothetical protein BDP67DRAFT_388985, partial [Colletotrichum lupini]
TYLINKSTARILKYSFKPLFRTIVLINPLFRFNKVNILINRNSLKKLLNFY